MFSLQPEIGVIVIERSRVQSNDIGVAAQVLAVALLAGIALLHNTAVEPGPGRYVGIHLFMTIQAQGVLRFFGKRLVTSATIGLFPGMSRDQLSRH